MHLEVAASVPADFIRIQLGSVSPVEWRQLIDPQMQTRVLLRCVLQLHEESSGKLEF